MYVVLVVDQWCVCMYVVLVVDQWCVCMYVCIYYRNLDCDYLCGGYEEAKNLPGMVTPPHPLPQFQLGKK